MSPKLPKYLINTWFGGPTHLTVQYKNDLKTSMCKREGGVEDIVNVDLEEEHLGEEYSIHQGKGGDADIVLGVTTTT